MTTVSQQSHEGQESLIDRFERRVLSTKQDDKNPRFDKLGSSNALSEMLAIAKMLYEAMHKGRWNNDPFIRDLIYSPKIHGDLFSPNQLAY